MCKKTNYKIPNPRIDKCMLNLVNFINKHTDFKTVSCCCGHNKYPVTLLVRHPIYDKGYALEVFSRKVIMRSRNFYKRDKPGYYYIPEIKK